MNAKLTLSLDKEVIEKAKKYARRRDKSLSKVVENYLRQLAEPGNGDGEITPLVAELSGLIDPARVADHRKGYADYLEEKYR